MFNTIHLTIPADGTLHILSGYQEVIDTLLWGLKEIGYEVSFSFSHLRPDARNIVFKAETAPPEVLKSFPADTIIYSLEQSYELFLSPEKPKDESLARRLESYVYIRKNFEVWDYSCKNITAMMTIDSKMPVKHVPIGFAPILQRIARPQNQDIDVLIYGMPHDYRLGVFKKLCEKWQRCLFVCGLYGSARDELISRSKIILNLSDGRPESIFPIVRASYLLANRKLVVSDIQPELYVEADMAEAVKFCPTKYIPLFCHHWLSNDSERLQAENKGFEIMARRDIRAILLAALA